VVFDVRANHHGISHYLHGDQATIETLRGSLRALMPSLRFESATPCLKPVETYSYGRMVRLRGRLPVLLDDDLPETSAALLAALRRRASWPGPWMLRRCQA